LEKGLTYPGFELQPLTISDEENYVDSTQQREGKRVVDEQSEVVESDPPVRKSKGFFYHLNKIITTSHCLTLLVQYIDMISTLLRYSSTDQ
jgi:hypothetical protein